MKSLAVIVVAVFISTSANASQFEIINQAKSPASVSQQAEKDYETMRKCLAVFGKEPRKIVMVVYPFKKRYEAIKKREPLTALAEGYELSDGSILIQVYPKRGVIVHELMHAFARSIESEGMREEFFCSVSGYLLDGFTKDTRLVFTGGMTDEGS